MRVIVKQSITEQLTRAIAESEARKEVIDCIELSLDEKRMLVAALHKAGESAAANTLQVYDYAIYEGVKVVVPTYHPS